MDVLLALLIYLGIFPAPTAVDSPTVPTLAGDAGDGGTADDPLRPRPCGRNCSY